MIDTANAAIELIGWALIHFVWQGTVIGVITLMLLTSLRRAGAQTRYAVIIGATILCLLAPLFSISQGLSNGATLSGSQAADTTPAPLALRDLPIHANASALSVNDFLPWLTGLWLVGLCVMTLRFIVGLRWLDQLRTQSQPLALIEKQLTADVITVLSSRFNHLAVQNRLQRRVSLRIISESQQPLHSPITLGWLKPMVIFPLGLLTRLDSEQIEALLAHELAHIRRHDFLVNQLQRLVEILLFFHPVVWWLSRCASNERELIADELAASVTRNRTQLAAALVELSRWQTECERWALPAKGGQLFTRIQHLVLPQAQSNNPWLCLPILVGTLIISAAVVAQTQLPKEQQKITADDVKLNLKNANSSLPYALVNSAEEGFAMSGSLDDVADIVNARKKIDGDFLWFRRDGEAFIVQDADTLKKVQQARAATLALEEKMQALDTEMSQHSVKMDQLSNQMEQLADVNIDSSKIEAASEQIELLVDQQLELTLQERKLTRKLETETREKKHAALKKELAMVTQKQQRVATQLAEQSQLIEATTQPLDAIEGPMSELSQQMAMVSRPMEIIGSKMTLVGQEIELEVNKAEAEIVSLIEQAMTEGKARNISD